MLKKPWKPNLTGLFNRSHRNYQSCQGETGNPIEANRTHNNHVDNNDSGHLPVYVEIVIAAVMLQQNAELLLDPVNSGQVKEGLATTVEVKDISLATALHRGETSQL